MQELIDPHHSHQQHSGFVVIAPQVSYMPSLTSASEAIGSSSNNNWIGIPSSLCSTHASYQPQFMTETNTYPFASHIASNSLPKPALAHNFQSELESMSNQCEPQSRATTLLKSAKKKKSPKSNYKHIPHREKPTHLVARRNARERRRVQAVNSAFVRLRKCVPVENRNKRLSKVKTLHRAIEYIAALQDLIREADQSEGIPSDESNEQMMNGFVKSEIESTEKKYNKENRIEDQKWISFETDCEHFSEPYVTNNYSTYRYLKCIP